MAITQLIPTKYRLLNALNFANSVGYNAFYAYASQSQNWLNTSAPQDYDNPITTNFNTFNNMLFGKRLQPTDVSLMCSPSQWISGTVYTMYDDTNPNISTSNFFVYTFDGSYYYIFKCLFNNNGAPSTVIPATIDTTYPFSSNVDNYVWKYMYKIDKNLHDKFALGSYKPIVPDTAVANNAIPGSLDIIVPVDANGNIVAASGAGYNNYYYGSGIVNPLLSGTNLTVQLGPTANGTTGFYNGCYFYINSGSGSGQHKTVLLSFSNSSGIYAELDSVFSGGNPDNTSTYVIAPPVILTPSSDNVATTTAIAMISANSGNSVYGVQVLNRGSGIYYSGAFVNASATVGVTNTALLRVICPPEGGHGANVYSELYSNSVSVSFTFANSENSTIPTVGQYHSIGLMTNPQFANVTFTISNFQGTQSQFNVGEAISQVVSGNITANAIVTSINGSVITVTNASPYFTVGGTILDSTNPSIANAQITAIQVSGANKDFTTFTQFYTYNGYYAGGTFNTNEIVYQGNSSISNAAFFANTSDGSSIYITSKFGPIYSGYSDTAETIPFTLSSQLTNTRFNIQTITYPDLIPESGDIIYSENFSTINRSATSSETTKLLLQF